jgi:hypothetical protein
LSIGSENFCTQDIEIFYQLLTQKNKYASRRLVYRGQLDDSRPQSGIPVTGKDLRAAIDTILIGQAVTWEQKPSIGCNIKWKPGNEPVYFKNPALAFA